MTGLTRRQSLYLLFAREPRFRAAAFRADATPPLGEPLIWVDPAKEILDPLWAKGVVIEDGNRRYVLCALDWCGVGGSVHAMFRQRLADAARTPLANVVLQSVHQHTAPYVDGDAYALMDQLPNPPLRMSRSALNGIASKMAAAVTDAVARLQPFDSVGFGSAEAESIASARRIVMPDGKLLTRFSTGAKNPAMAELPEGDIDRTLRTVTLARGGKPLVRIHCYASHPQTFCCDGRVTADFVGAAREEIEKAEGVPQIWFAGCGGDVTVGKYNDGSDSARAALQARLTRALRASVAATRLFPARDLSWRTTGLRLPPRTSPDKPQDAYRSAILEAFRNRRAPIQVSSLHLGAAQMLFLPGEPMLEFSRHARSLAKDREVVVAGYGDISPGYLCTDEAHRQGGYEPSASYAGPGTETALKAAIRTLIRA